MKIDFAQLKELLEIVSQNDISELTVESGEERITVKKPHANLMPEFPLPPHMVTHAGGTSPQAANPAIAVQAPQSTEQPEVKPSGKTPGPVASESKNDFLKITSPMVGTFYRSPAPDKPSFVEAGDTITVGQTVCIIEAMKLMNDLPSEVSGRIIEVLAQDGATVEYGQPLFLVDPHV